MTAPATTPPTRRGSSRRSSAFTAPTSSGEWGSDWPSCGASSAGTAETSGAAAPWKRARRFIWSYNDRCLGLEVVQDKNRVFERHPQGSAMLSARRLRALLVEDSED